MISGIVILAGVINPWVFIPTAPLAALFFYLRRYFLRTSRDVKRLEATSMMFNTKKFNKCMALLGWNLSKYSLSCHLLLHNLCYVVYVMLAFNVSARSPVFSHLSVSLQGLHTIRAYKSENIFTEEFHKHQDLHTEAWGLFLSSSRWFAIRLDWLCAFFVSSVAFCSVFAADSKYNC